MDNVDVADILQAVEELKQDVLRLAEMVKLVKQELGQGLAILIASPEVILER